MKKELLKGLNEEQIAKVEACDDVRDLLQLAKDEGVELTPEQLEAVSGGGCSDDDEGETKKKDHPRKLEE